MLKAITAAAMATVMMSAFAQDSTSGSMTITTYDYQTSRPWAKEMDMSGKNLWEQKRHVEKMANWSLSGADRYNLAETLDRAPMSVENALVHGLTNSHRQAVVINDRVLAMRFPADSMTTTTSTANANGSITTTTTTDTWASNMDWSNEEHGFRPMRLVMTSKVKPKDISYNDAIDILTSNLSETERGILQDWWFMKASDGQKDTIVRMLKSDASIVDETYYPSVYMHRTYSWVTNP